MVIGHFFLSLPTFTRHSSLIFEVLTISIVGIPSAWISCSHHSFNLELLAGGLLSPVYAGAPFGSAPLLVSWIWCVGKKKKNPGLKLYIYIYIIFLSKKKWRGSQTYHHLWSNRPSFSPKLKTVSTTSSTMGLIEENCLRTCPCSQCLPLRPGRLLRDMANKASKGLYLT